MEKTLLALIACVVLFIACDMTSSSTSSENKSDNHSKNCPYADEPLTDPRDGKVYKTIKIGDQIWMAENLNYDTTFSWTTDSLDKDGSIYGRFYEFSSAKTACPEGWHLPSREEFRVLIRAVGGDSLATWNLKTTSGWNQDNDGHDANGADTYCFGAKAAGEMNNQSPNANSVGEYGLFWTKENYTPKRHDYTYGITYDEPEEAFVLKISNDNAQEVRFIGQRTYYTSSIRCLKGDPEPEQPLPVTIIGSVSD